MKNAERFCTISVALWEVFFVHAVCLDAHSLQRVGRKKRYIFPLTTTVMCDPADTESNSALLWTDRSKLLRNHQLAQNTQRLSNVCCIAPSQAWKANVMPKLESHLAHNVNSVTTYYLLHHEVTLTNLLEVCLYH